MERRHRGEILCRAASRGEAPVYVTVMIWQAIALHQRWARGQTVGEPVQIPATVDVVAISWITAAPESDLAVFDCYQITEVFEDGQWRVRDTNAFARTLDDAGSSIVMRNYARLERVAGKLVRATSISGQCPVAVSAILTTEVE